jgi:hypothetical protein
MASDITGGIGMSAELSARDTEVRTGSTGRLGVALLGVLVIALALVAVVGFAMGDLLEGVVPLSPTVVGALAAAGALTGVLGVVLVVSRARRRLAEEEFPEEELSAWLEPGPRKQEEPRSPEGNGHRVPAAVGAPAPVAAHATFAVSAPGEAAPVTSDEVQFAPVGAAPAPAPVLTAETFRTLVAAAPPPEPPGLAVDLPVEAGTPPAAESERRRVLPDSWFFGPK